MMMLYLRLLAGLTSFKSKRCLSQLFSMGPVGHFPSSITITPLIQNSKQNGEWNSGIPEEQGQRSQGTGLGQERLYPVIAPAHGLEEALDAVGQMQKQNQHGSGIDQRYQHVLERGYDHA